MARFSDQHAGELVEALIESLSGEIKNDRRRLQARGGARLVGKALTRFIRGE